MMELTRRSFIGGGVAVATCAASAFLHVGSRDSSGSSVREFQPVPNVPDDLAEILFYASLAPSGHNAQPWYVRLIDRNNFNIGCDARRRLPAIDPQNRETLLSLGAFIENLAVAAGAKGYETTLEVVALSPSDEDIVKVSLQKATPGKYPLKKLLSRRKVKNGHKPIELKDADAKFLLAPLGDHGFYFPRNSEHAQCIADGAVEAFRAQSYREDAQRELAEWIRFSRKEAQAHRDGMTPDSMEIGGIAGWYVRNFMHKDDVLKSSFREKGIEDAARTAQEGAGWIIITSKGESVSDLIETGRRLERMWLLARERMIAVQPMSQMLEETKWKTEIASKHKPDMIPQFILRVGYLDSYPDPVTLRRPPGWFVRL